MALSTPTVLTEDGSTTNKTSGNAYVTAEVTPTANALVILCTEIGTATAPTISGLDATWNLVQEVDFDTVASPSDSLYVYRAQMGASPPTGAITITMNANATTGEWKVFEFTGHDTTTPIADSDVGSGNAEATFTCATLDATGTTTVFVFAFEGVGTITLEGSYTDIGVKAVGDFTLHAGYISPVDTTPSATLNASRDWAAIGFQVAEAGGTDIPRAPAAGSALLAGVAAALDFGLGMGLGAASLTGYEPLALDQTPGEDVPMAPDLQALVLSGSVSPMDFGILMPDEA